MSDTEHGHDHPLKPSLVALVGICLVGLLAAVVISYLDARSTGQRLEALEEYVQGRGDFRDAEADRIERQSTERIRRALCDLLDQLPEGGLLDRPREKYECGPGLPPESLPPEVQRELSGRARPTPVSPAEAREDPPVGSAVTPGPDAPPSPGPPPTPADPGPEPELLPDPESPPPPVDLSPITGTLCDAFGLCL